MITTIRGHRHITFKNGCVLSIFNGFGSYSENHFNFKARNKWLMRTKDCEIAVLRNDFFITRNVLKCSNDVMGYVDKRKLKRIIKKVKKYKE